MSYLGKGVVLRFGELFLKGKNRYLFEDMLEANVRTALRGFEDVQVLKKHGRIFVLGDSGDDLVRRLKEVFGIASISPAVFCNKDLDEMAAAALDLAKNRPPGVESFRISARRSDKGFEKTSAEIITANPIPRAWVMVGTKVENGKKANRTRG